MTYRTSQQIYPPNYEFALIEKDAQQQCGRIWAEAVYCQNMQHIYREINQEVDPYNREYLVTVMHELILTKSTSDDYDSVRLTSYQMEQLEADERRIIKKARGEQFDEQTDTVATLIEQPAEREMVSTIDIEKARVYQQLAQANILFLDKVYIDLDARLTKVEAVLNCPEHERVEQFKYISPLVTDEKERENIHKIVVNLVTSDFKLSQICGQLKELINNKKIALYVSTTDQYNELVRLGLPKGKSGYTQKNYENYMSEQKK